MTGLVNRIAHAGFTPLVVSRDDEIFGIVNLKDILKSGIQERFSSSAASASRR